MKDIWWYCTACDTQQVNRKEPEPECPRCGAIMEAKDNPPPLVPLAEAIRK